MQINFSIKNLFKSQLLFFCFMSSSCSDSSSDEPSALGDKVQNAESIAYHPDIRSEDTFLSFTFRPEFEKIQLYWKDENGAPLGNFLALKNHIEKQGQELIFAMNAGIFMKDQSPIGLYIEDGKTLRPLNLKKAKGNFYLQPNGVFFVKKDGSAGLSISQNFKTQDVIYASQSGPLLLIEGKVNANFSPTASSKNKRNGVGIRADGVVVFLFAKTPLTFYDFAAEFKRMGCVDALYFDGAISDFYVSGQAPAQYFGLFGPMLAILRKK